MNKKTIKIKITFTENVLGTLSGNQELTKEFIISKSKDESKIQEESETIDAMQNLQKSTTYFPRDKDGNAFFYDYQLKGFVKDAIGIMVEMGDCSISKWGFKRIVDNSIFISPRKIMIKTKDDVIFIERPLRADTMQGERIALARSEAFKPGTEIEFELTYLVSSNAKSKSREINDELIQSVLEYGALKGIGQWRNSGCGRFSFEIIQ